MLTVFEFFLRGLGAVLYHVGLARAVIWTRRRCPKVLMYHACVPAESDFIRGLRSNTRPDDFAAHLEFLQRYYNVIALSDLEQGTYPERAVVITFDDGYRSVYEHAFPRLKAHGCPATVYLVTNVVGNEALVWVNELNWFLNAHPGTSLAPVRRRLGAPDSEGVPALVDRARANYDSTSVQSMLEELRVAAGVDRTRLAAEANLYVDWDEVRTMTAAGVSFGNHTASHPNLTRLDADAQSDELRTGRDVTASHTGNCTSLAYPFGDRNDELRTVALALGHKSVMEVGGVNAPLDLSRVARVPVYARSDAEFFTEMEILTPAKSFVKRLLARR